MATETTTTFDESGSNNSDLIRKIVAAVVGIIVIILVVLLAKWLGDLIKTRLIDKKTSTVVTTFSKTGPADSTNPASGNPVYDSKTGTYKISTISTIPSTGPNDNIYIGLVAMGLIGTSILVYSKKLPTI
jgi:LPXTG-motif cell wall-anchored protein